MKNILSYSLGTQFSGREIKDWITYHLDHQTSHTKQAKYLRRFLTVNDDDKYKLCKENYSSCGSCGEYMFVRC